MNDREKIRKRRLRRRRKLIKLGIVASGLFVIVICSVLLLIVATKKSDSKINIIGKDSKEKTADILVAGDVMIHSPIYNSAYYHNTTSDTYDFSDIFRYIKDTYNQADYTICTFEGALAGGELCGYPNFITPKEIMKNLKDSGIDCLNLASNHVYDGKDEGIHATMDELDKLGMDYLGLRKSTDIQPYSIIEVNGIKIGMIDYVYETGNYKTINWIDVSNESDPIINSFNFNYLDQFYTEVDERYRAMKNAGAEVCIIYMHWGNEYELTEASYQDTMAQKLCDIGFNAIIGSHPHVEQPVDLLKSSDGSHLSLVCYAIGNHLSNQRYEKLYNYANGQTEDGCMVNLTIKKDSKGNVSIQNIKLIYTWVYMQTTNGSNQYYILPLDHYESLEEITGIKDFGTDLTDSIARSNAIMKNGYVKLQPYLPIQVPN